MDMDGRVSQMEQELARLGQRIHDLKNQVVVVAAQVDRLTEVYVTIARMQEVMIGMREDINAVIKDMGARDTRVTEERRAARNALWGLTSAIVVLGLGVLLERVLG